MTDIFTTVRDFGTAIAVAVGLAFFGYQAVWPFLVKQVEDSKQQREQERAEFLTALERRDAELAKISTALNDLTGAVRQMQDWIKK